MDKALPAIVWMDDEFEKFLWMHKVLLEKQGDCGFEIKFFKDTDEAVEFTLDNLDRIFLFIQDSSRYSKLLNSWKELRPLNPSVLDRTSAGAFYTYLIDAFTPEAGSIFAGYGYSVDQTNFIYQWSEKDKRILFADKYQLATGFGLGRQGYDIFSVAAQQLARWTTAKANLGRSEESKALDTLLEEMTVLCSINQSKLHKLTPRQFEELIAYLFKNHGFDVELTARTRDGGYDIILADHSSLSAGPILVECKQFAPGRPVGVGVVRALIWSQDVERRFKINTCNKFICLERC